MGVRVRRIHLVVIALSALIALVHCGFATDRDRERDDATSRSAAALGCAAQWDPTWRQESGADEWWVEYAISGGTVTSAHLEVVGVGDVPLTFEWEKWVGPSTFRIPTGTSVVVHAQASDGRTAQTQAFGYLAEAAPVTSCGTACVPACQGHSCGSDGCGGSCGTCAAGQACTNGTCTGGGGGGGACWNPTWQQTTDANNWWVEYGISDTTVTSALLEVVGVHDVPLSFEWGVWVGPTGSMIVTGAQVVVQATNAAGQTARTLPLRYLVDTRPVTDCGGACVPSCAGRACGTDGCGGSCGTCAAGQTCTSGACNGGTSDAGGGGSDAGGGGTPAVRFVGRADTSDAAHPKFGWPGARIIARFSGTTATVSLDEESLYTGPSRWDVLVDGTRTSTLAPRAGSGTYTIASGLANTVHTIELYKITEGLVGQTQFMGFTFPNGGQLLAPPDPPSRRILFLGDSTTCGYGDLCTSPLDSFSGATETERLAFAGLVAHDLGADHQDISYSGKGVLLNYDRADREVFDQLFPRALPMSATPTWDFSRFTPDVVWMNLGGNDWDQESPSTPPPDLDAYTQKYIDLAALVRSTFPDAQIIVSVTPSLNDDYPVGWNVLTNQRTALRNVVAARSAAGDAKIAMYEFARATHDQLTGCDYHTPLTLHRTMADQVITQIKAKTGWN